jgi:hypothetical protein
VVEDATVVLGFFDTSVVGLWSECLCIFLFLSNIDAWTGGVGSPVRQTAVLVQLGRVAGEEVRLVVRDSRHGERGAGENQREDERELHCE